MSGRVLGIIPARLSSTRLPNKPLHPILGRPLIEWVWRRVEGMRVLDEVVVATDSEEVAEICRSMGASVAMTSPLHPSGTDRVAEVARLERYSGFEVIANIQGDEPLLEEGHLEAAVELVLKEGWQIGTCATPIIEAGAWNDPSAVKVVRAESGRALYFSRSPIPFKRDGEPTSQEFSGKTFLRHIGIYTYTPEALEEWVALAPSALEQLEMLEQLRPLGAGAAIGVAVVGASAPGVDTPADARRVEELLEELQTGPDAMSGR